jgi:hypothetical protein
MPQHVATPGGFSSAGAMRTPQTLKGPVVPLPAAIQPVQAKAPARNGQKALRRAVPPGTDKKAALQPTPRTAAPAEQ